MASQELLSCMDSLVRYNKELQAFSKLDEKEIVIGRGSTATVVSRVGPVNKWLPFLPEDSMGFCPVLAVSKKISLGYSQVFATVLTNPDKHKHMNPFDMYSAPSSEVMEIFQAKEDAEEDSDARNSEGGGIFIPVRIMYHHDDRTVWCTESTCEVGIGYLIRKHILEPLVSPHFLQMGMCCRSTRRQYEVLFERAACGLRDVLTKLSSDQIRSLVFQVLSALEVGQRIIRLKHHDLHEDNVFLTPVTKEGLDIVRSRILGDDGNVAFDEWKRHIESSGGMQFIRYEIPAGDSVAVFQVPTLGFLVKIGDFALSSARDPDTGVYVKRMDFDMLSTEDDEEDDEDYEEDAWGLWTPELDGHEGYDSQYFLHCLSRVLKKKGIRGNMLWLSVLLDTLGGRVSVTQKRPIEVSEQTPAKLLLHPIFEGWRIA
jgi:hypothetical protein